MFFFSLDHFSDLSLYIRLEDPLIDFDFYHVELFRLEDNQAECLAIYDDLSDSHQVSINISVSKEAWVTFFNRTHGAYCVVVNSFLFNFITPFQKLV